MIHDARLDLDAVKHELESRGYCYVAPAPLDFDHVSELGRLGPLQSQYGGELVRDVKVDPRVPDDEISAASTSELTPHTELYERQGIPPRYVALWSLHTAVGTGGETTLADGYRLLDGFTPEECERLETERQQWRSRPTLKLEYGGMETEVAEQPVIELIGTTRLLRFSSLDMVIKDELSERYVAEGRRFFATHHFPILIEERATLIWDNWRMLHARRSFTDRRRHLRRVLVGASHTY